MENIAITQNIAITHYQVGQAWRCCETIKPTCEPACGRRLRGGGVRLQLAGRIAVLFSFPFETRRRRGPLLLPSGRVLGLGTPTA